MDALKWIGSILLALIGWGLLLTIVGAVVAASTFIWVVLFAIAAVWFTARLIKDLIEAKPHEDL